MKTKVKIGIVVLTVVTLTSGLVIGVGAAGNLLHGSTGRIEIDQNDDGTPEAVFDAQDLDDLDTAITTGKTNVASAMNVYPNTSIPSFPTFQEIIDGIDTLTNVPADTYYYDKTTGVDDASTIKRYKLVGNEYFECNGDGTLIDEIADTVTIENLITYSGIANGNLSVGSAGYVNHSLVLGNGTDNLNAKKDVKTTILNSFSGREIVALDTRVNNGTIVTNIDPAIFSTIRITGQFWNGAAGSGYYYSEVRHNEIWLEDAITNEKVYESSVSGHPFNKTISLDGYPNPVNVKCYFDIYYGTNSCGESYIGQVLCEIR